ncbi:Putative flippase GtrA (transmembrane translocase of bactoprenol-linked glucose) [Isobaculum melis]|uniref:Putative flippase GtrA (Transmembrane translocase of bactoprenol-linked glucose) n=2 Tax=Isobaculum melis TaxID=142588 RepID=A0A1H9UH48_9LACT|nr:Putative flippase GtrA (transmembrane translocase of bactoprenol-linked glucose) [Isobaculum melis]
MKELIKRTYLQYQTFLTYAFWGIFATGINIVTYFLFANILHLSVITSNIGAWILTTIFGFITSRHRVFKSETTGFKNIWHEWIQFASFRGTSLLADTCTMWLTIEILGWHALIAKTLANLIAALINYSTSKRIVFKNQNRSGEDIRKRLINAENK